MAKAAASGEASIEEFLDGVRSSSIRHAVQLREIAHARKAVADAEQRLREAVAAARAAGDSWSAIGVVLRTSKQNAYRKFAN